MLRFEVIAAMILAVFAVFYVLNNVAPHILPASILEQIPF